jgi:hypothetical protein
VWKGGDAAPEAVDVLRGEPLGPVGSAVRRGVPGAAAVSVRIPPHGIAGVALVPASDPLTAWEEFLAGQREHHAAENRSQDVTCPAEQRLSRGSGEWSGIPPMRSLAQLGSTFIQCVPPKDGVLTQTVRYRVRECHYVRDLEQVHWREARHETRSIEKRVTLRSFEIVSQPVTNGQYHAFLQDTGYEAPQAETFLAHWRGGAPVPGSENEPVVYVSLEDARAFATWAGLCIPTEEEWQFAAEQPDFTYGQVWELTESERSDGHTRYLIVKGGSPTAARRVNWYMDSGPKQPEWSTKVILMNRRLDRCSTVGFRCIQFLDQD